MLSCHNCSLLLVRSADVCTVLPCAVTWHTHTKCFALFKVLPICPRAEQKSPLACCNAHIFQISEICFLACALSLSVCMCVVFVFATAWAFAPLLLCCMTLTFWLLLLSNFPELQPETLLSQHSWMLLHLGAQFILFLCADKWHAVTKWFSFVGIPAYFPYSLQV